MQEIENTKWTPIPGFNQYFISEEGKVLSRKGKKPQFLKPRTDNNQKNKPFFVFLYNNGKSKKKLVSFLMATTFIENPNKYKLIKFIDGNNLNHKIHNLEWSNNPFSLTSEWKVLNNYPSYEISEIGVRNINTKKIVKPQIETPKYPTISLKKNKRTINVAIHILIAKQFIPNPFNLTEVNHIDGNKLNYSINNLEWVTGKQNSQHAHDTKLNKGSRGKGRHIELLDENYQVIQTFTSILNANAFIGVTPNVINGRLKRNVLGDGTTVINGYRIRFKIHNDIDGEIWKNVKTENDFINNYYEVSNYARVRNIKTKIILIPDTTGRYHRVNLKNNINETGGTKYFVHRLVAFTFQPYKGKQSDYQVDHIDKNTENNKECNLQIMKTKEHMIKDHGIPVLGLNNNNEYVMFDSYSLAGKFINLDSNSSQIGRSILRNGICRGYKWFKLDSEKAQEIMSNDIYERIQ